MALHRSCWWREIYSLRQTDRETENFINPLWGSTREIDTFFFDKNVFNAIRNEKNNIALIKAAVSHWEQQRNAAVDLDLEAEMEPSESSIARKSKAVKKAEGV